MFTTNNEGELTAAAAATLARNGSDYNEYCFSLLSAVEKPVRRRKSKTSRATFSMRDCWLANFTVVVFVIDVVNGSHLNR